MPAHDFETELAAAWPPQEWRDVTVLAAVSGGADSTALLRGLSAIRAMGQGRLIVAHFNHRLRGVESDGDAAFVADLCGQLKLPCEIGTASQPQANEESARDDRYAFLIDTARRTGARYVVTAHTADDQAETILHRILRGTGLAGLAGMPRARALADGISLLRPLLNLCRDDVQQYLAHLHQDFRQDHSNQDLRFTRNRIRHELLPRLAADYNPAVRAALLRLGALAGEAHDVVARLAADLAKRCLLGRTAERLDLDSSTLVSPGEYLAREALLSLWRQQGWPLQGIGHEQWTLVSQMAMPRDPQASSPSKTTLPGGIMVERSGETLSLTFAKGS